MSIDVIALCLVISINSYLCNILSEDSTEPSLYFILSMLMLFIAPIVFLFGVAYGYE